jgi:hypothetical protein
MVHVTLAASLGFAEADPVGGFVAGAVEAGDLDEGFDEDGAVAIVSDASILAWLETL